MTRIEVTLEQPLAASDHEVILEGELQEDLETVLKTGSPPPRELQKARLVLDLSEFFDVSVKEASRWVQQTEEELEARDKESIVPGRNDHAAEGCLTPESEYEDAE